ncbi:MAG: thiamine-phosphate kinase [Deltaproteobacteria bacterium]|nr:thiamine-phosphate kinase [Deltaproteobacteria bacterium]
MDIKDIGELKLIQRIADNYRSSLSSIVTGIGDDAAALKISENNILLATCDLLLEDVHFNLNFTDSYQLGRKSLAVNLSDIAAMGGTPLFFLVSLALPRHLPIEFIDDLYRGMTDLADEFDTKLVGGDTNTSPDKLMINITLLGEANPDHLLKRSGAQVGDSIFVTGTLGDAALGFFILEFDKNMKRSYSHNTLTYRHLSPYPRIKEGIRIAENRLASAMIDISDGLLIDLRRILTLSKLGATIYIPQLPLSKEFKQYQGKLKHNKIDFALKGGEDYELLFTSPQNKEKELLKLGQTLGVPINKIGEVNSSEELVILDQNHKSYPIDDQGYDHFSSP